MSLVSKITEAKQNLKQARQDHLDKIKAEENILVNIKFDNTTLEYLQAESEIEAKRAVRTFNIQRLEEEVSLLDYNYNAYIQELLLKSEASYKKRVEKLKESWIKNHKIYPYNARNISFGGKDYTHIFSIQRSYYPANNRWESKDASGKWVVGNTLYVPLKYRWLTPVKLGTNIRKQSVGYSFEKHAYTTSYGISEGAYFSLFWQAYIGNKPLDLKIINKLKEVLSINYITSQRLLKDRHPYDFRKALMLEPSFEIAGWQPSSIMLNTFHLINWLYPPVRQYIQNPELYPYAQGFAEEKPWPSSRDLDAAVKGAMKIGSQSWTEAQIKHLLEIAKANTEIKDANFAITLALPNSTNFGPTNVDQYNDEKIIPYINLANTGNIDPNLDPAVKYYSPRPKEKYFYIPYFDYINPQEYVSLPKREAVVFTPKGEYLDAVARAEEEQRRQAKINKWRRLSYGLKSLGGSSFVNFIFNPFGFVAEIVCFNEGYDSEACSVVLDSAAVARTIVKAYVAAFVGYMTGGTGAAIAGGVSAVASDPNLGLVDTDIGRIIIVLGEAYAIASVTDAAMDKVLQEALEQQIYAITKREIGKATGLDRTLLGRVGLDLSTGTAFNMYKGADLPKAIIGSADKSWRLSVARENPYGALLIAGVTEIEKNNWSINSMNPLDWFEGVSIGSEFTRARRSITGKDLARVIGLTYMVSSGRISEADALLMIGQEASKRNIERFYNDEPLKQDPELKAYREKQREVSRWKKGIAVMQKLSTGVPPTKEDIVIISDDVAGPIYDRVKALGLPMDAEIRLWDIAINDVGLPNLSQFTPDISFEIPDWMKSKKSDGQVVITNKEEMENYLDKRFTESTEFTKEDLVKIILGLFPRNVPLVPIANTNTEPTFNWIDEFGVLKVRDPLRFPYDHPMLTSGNIRKKYTKDQKVYVDARKQELIIAQNQMMVMQKKLDELQRQIGLG